MRMTLVRSVFAAATVVCATAQADVVYNWQTLSPFPQDPQLPLSGRLVIDDSAWVAGSFKQGQNFLSGGLRVDPDSALIRFEFTPGPRINFRAPFQQIYSFDGSIGVGPSLFLTGSIRANDTFADIAMSGGPIWTITSLGQDLAGPCFDRVTGGGLRCDGDRSGATGAWVLDLSSAPVLGRISLPGTVPLLALTWVAAVAGLRKRKG